MHKTEIENLVKDYLNKGGKIVKCRPGYAKTEPRRFKYSVANQGRKYNTLKNVS